MKMSRSLNPPHYNRKSHKLYYEPTSLRAIGSFPFKSQRNFTILRVFRPPQPNLTKIKRISPPFAEGFRAFWA